MTSRERDFKYFEDDNTHDDKERPDEVIPESRAIILLQADQYSAQVSYR